MSAYTDMIEMMADGIYSDIGEGQYSYDLTRLPLFTADDIALACQDRLDAIADEIDIGVCIAAIGRGEPAGFEAAVNRMACSVILDDVEIECERRAAESAYEDGSRTEYERPTAWDPS